MDVLEEATDVAVATVELEASEEWMGEVDVALDTDGLLSFILDSSFSILERQEMCLERQERALKHQEKCPKCQEKYSNY